MKGTERQIDNLRASPMYILRVAVAHQKIRMGNGGHGWRTMTGTRPEQNQ